MDNPDETPTPENGEGAKAIGRLCDIYHREIITFLRREYIGQTLRYVSSHLNAVVAAMPVARMPRRQFSSLAILTVSYLNTVGRCGLEYHLVIPWCITEARPQEHWRVRVRRGADRKPSEHSLHTLPLCLLPGIEGEFDSSRCEYRN